MQEYASAMGGCEMVDRTSPAQFNYRGMETLLRERVRNREIQFIDKAGLWQSFFGLGRGSEESGMKTLLVTG